MIRTGQNYKGLGPKSNFVATPKKNNLKVGFDKYLLKHKNKQTLETNHNKPFWAEA